MAEGPVEMTRDVKAEAEVRVLAAQVHRVPAALEEEEGAKVEEGGAEADVTDLRVIPLVPEAEAEADDAADPAEEDAMAAEGVLHPPRPVLIDLQSSTAKSQRRTKMISPRIRFCRRPR